MKKLFIVRPLMLGTFSTLLMALLFCCTTGKKSSEIFEISGRVFEKQSSAPLSGALVLNKTTGSGTVSDDDGHFKLDVMEGDSVSISYVGLLQRNISVSASDSLFWNVEMEEYGPIIEPALISCYSTDDEFRMTLANPSDLKLPLDSLVLVFENNSDKDAVYGDKFEIQRRDSDGFWREVPYDERFRDKDGNINIAFNAIAYVLAPGSMGQKVEKPWLYGENIGKGTYRIAKDFWIGKYSGVSDTVYVEFEIM